MEMENKKLRDVAEIARQIMVGEELKGGQKKLDKNHNNKIDAQDLAIVRAQKEEVEEVDEAIRPEDVPAYLRKAKGEKPLTVASVKGAHKDSISHPTNLALKRSSTSPGETVLSREEVETLDEVSLKTATSAYVKRMGKIGRAHV